MARYATPPATERSGIFDSPSPPPAAAGGAEAEDDEEEDGGVGVVVPPLGIVEMGEVHADTCCAFHLTCHLATLAWIRLSRTFRSDGRCAFADG